MCGGYVGLIENGKSAASIITLVMLAIALECEVGDLFPYIEDLKPCADWPDEELVAGRCR